MDKNTKTITIIRIQDSIYIYRITSILHQYKQPGEKGVSSHDGFLKLYLGDKFIGYENFKLSNFFLITSNLYEIQDD